VFVGDGAVLYEDVVRRARGADALVLPAPLLAGAIGRLAARDLGRGAPSNPAAVHPLYVRRPDAEVARDARR